MKSFIAGFIILFLILSGTAFPANLYASPIPWHINFIEIFESTAFKLSINFPGAYEQETSEKTGDNNAVTKTLKLTCSHESKSYMVNVTKHPFSLGEETEKLNEVSLESFVEAVGGELKSQKVFTQEGNKGIDAVIHLSALSKYIFYRIVIKERLQYQVIVITDNESASATEQNFRDSFKILK